METKHTTTLRVSVSDNGYQIRTHALGKDNRIATINTSMLDQKGWAEGLVDRFNAHDDLVKFAEMARAELLAMGYDPRDQKWMADGVAALAKAKAGAA